MFFGKQINKSLVLSLFFIGSILLLSNREGRDEGNSNAPGETGTTCVNCHIRGPYTPVFDLFLSDAAGNRVTYYLPGQQYNFEVRVADISAKAKTFGFQTVPLDGEDNFVGTWGQLGSRVRKIKDLGREYLTHSSPSTTGIFKAVWTAPATDLGNITFYLAGVTADGEGASIGDNSDTTKFVVPSLTSSSTNIEIKSLEVFPTLTTDRITTLVADDLSFLRIFDTNGKMVLQKKDPLPGDFNIDVSDYGFGYYFIFGINKEGNLISKGCFLKF